MALAALKANKLRSFLTMLGIIIGVGTVIGTISLIQGLNRLFANQISALGSGTLYIQKMPWFAGVDFFLYRNRKDITMKEYEAVKKYATLAAAVAPEMGARRIVKYKSEVVEGIRIIGTTEESSLIDNALPQFGRYLTQADVLRRRNVCVIGASVAENLFNKESPIGKRVKIGGYPFRVVGVMEKQGKFFGHSLDDRAIIPVGVFRKLYGSRRWMTIKVRVIDQERMDEAIDELTGILRRVRRVPPGEENDFAINQQSTMTDMYNKITGAVYLVMIGVGSLSLLVGGIGIMTIMLASVTERTREIGIRKAIGARRRDILWQFLIEAATLSGVGGVLGVGLAFAIAKVVASASPIPANIPPWSILLGLGFSSVVGIFFGIFPSAKAAKLDPVEALRYE